MHPCLRVATPASLLQTSYSGIPPHTRPHRLQRVMPTYFGVNTPTPPLDTRCSSSTLIAPKAVELQSSIPPYLHTSASALRQCASSAPFLHTYASLHLQRGCGALGL